jgi:hypothetical protein
MLGSNHAGERAAAGLKATQLLRQRGLTWRDVIQLPIAERSGNDNETDEFDWQPVRRRCLQHASLLTPKELGFLINIGSWNGPLTERQHAWLDAIYERVRKAA